MGVIISVWFFHHLVAVETAMGIEVPGHSHGDTQEQQDSGHAAQQAAEQAEEDAQDQQRNPPQDCLDVIQQRQDCVVVSHGGASFSVCFPQWYACGGKGPSDGTGA